MYIWICFIVCAIKNLKYIKKSVRSPCPLCFCMPLKENPLAEQKMRREGRAAFLASRLSIPNCLLLLLHDRVLCLDLVGEMSTPSSTPMNNEVINPFAYISAVGTRGQGGCPSPPDFDRNINKTIFFITAWIN